MQKKTGLFTKIAIGAMAAAILLFFAVGLYYKIKLGG